MSQPKEIQAVIFDMDGVIVDSEPRHEKAILEVVREIGYGENHGIRFADWIGRTDHELWVDFISRHKPAHSLPELLAMKRNRMLEIVRRERPIFDGLSELVEKLSRKYSLALASGSELAVVQEVLKLDGLARFFPVVVTGSEVKRGKPAPDIFLRTAELLAVSPKNCAVIEDSKPGVAAGLAAGMTVVAITNTHPAAQLEHASHVVRSYKEIEQILLS